MNESVKTGQRHINLILTNTTNIVYTDTALTKPTAILEGYSLERIPLPRNMF